MMRAHKITVQPMATFLVCLTGPVVWALHFFFLYGAETLTCAAEPPVPNLFWWLALAATMGAGAGLAITIAKPPIRGDFPAAPFLHNAARLLAALALLAVVWAGVTALILPACA